MKATVVQTSSFRDVFTKDMESYIGKEIDVSPLEAMPGWYIGGDDDWFYHESWLDFKQQPPRRHEGSNMKSIPKGYKQVFKGLIKEGDLLSGRGLGPVMAARIAFGNPVEGAAKNGIGVYRKKPLPSYTKELRKAIGGIFKYVYLLPFRCDGFQADLDAAVKRIQRLNKKYF